MESEGSLLECRPYPEPDPSSLHLSTQFPKFLSNIIFPTMPRSSNWSLALSLRVKLITHLHPVPRSRMRGATPPLPNTSSLHGAYLSKGTTLPLQCSVLSTRKWVQYQ
jgi:hypothetical protein